MLWKWLNPTLFRVFASTASKASDKHSKPSCVFCSSQQKRICSTKFTQKKKTFFGGVFSPLLHCCARSLRLYSLYSKLFFMAICDYKKSSFEPFVYSARLFLLLIDFLLHIMGIQNRMNESGGDVVSVWIELDFGDACLAFVALRTNGFVCCLFERRQPRSTAEVKGGRRWCNFQRDANENENS